MVSLRALLQDHQLEAGQQQYLEEAETGVGSFLPVDDIQYLSSVLRPDCTLRRVDMFAEARSYHRLLTKNNRNPVRERKDSSWASGSDTSLPCQLL